VDAVHPRAQPCPHARQQGTAAIAGGLPPEDRGMRTCWTGDSATRTTST
jgi:hypothetical protein